MKHPRSVNFSRLSFAVAFCASAAAAPAFAQSVTGGLFGATRADAADRDKLNVLVAVAEGIDSDIPLEFASFLPQNDMRSGGRSTVSALSADYSRTGRRVQVFGTASSYVRYARRLDRVDAGSQRAQLGASLRLPKQGRLDVSQSAVYSPSYLYLLLPTAAPLAVGEATPSTAEFQIDQTESYAYQSRMTLAFGSAYGTRLTAGTEYTRNEFKNQPSARPELETYAATIKISRALSRRAAISAGYEYSAGRIGVLEPANAHQGTIGAEYTPPLSVTRRATFRVAVSSSMFDIPASLLQRVSAPAAAGRLYPFQGEASVDYPFRLKWRAVASYRRGVDYVPGMSEPMFTHGGRIKLVGVIGTRFDVSAFAGSATAASVISPGIRDAGSYTGEARLRYALTRNLALYSEYSYYYYDLRKQANLAPGLPEIYEQHGIRMGLMLFLQPIGR